MDRGVRIEDVTGLQTRVGWGAVLAGGVIALAAYLLLGLLFAGVGLSLTEAGLRAGEAGTAAVAAGVASVVAGLFAGGWVTTQLTAGETRREAVIHGILTWAVVTAAAAGMAGLGLRAGYNALLGAALAGQPADGGRGNWEQAARDAGVPPDKIDQLKQGLNPDNREKARQAAQVATWATFAGTLLSIAAAVVGAVAGSGPAFRLFPAGVAVSQAPTPRA